VLASGELEPAAHAVQASLPAAALYLPASHATHASPSGPVKPALHVQAVEAVLPSGELELDKHAVQASLPAVSLYLPATHATHAPPSGPVYPALHLQKVASPLPGPDHECAGHAAHVLLLTAATAVEYVPPGHVLHAPDPLAALNVPSPQATQGPPSGPV